MVSKKQRDKSWKDREKIIKIIGKGNILYLDLKYLEGYILGKIDLCSDKPQPTKERKR